MRAKNCFTIARRKQVMRLMTLICFFNFSGLNNGFTYFIVSSGKIERTDFAPVVVEKLGTVLNPANWTKVVSAKKWIRLLTHSSRAIEISSQKVLHNILTKSTFFQISLKSFYEKTLNEKAPSVNKSVSHEDEVLSLLVGEGAEQSLAQGKEHYGMDDPIGYLNTGSEKSWFRSERFNFCGKGKSEFGGVPKFLMNGRSKNKDHISLVSGGESAKKFVKFVRVRCGPRILYFVDSDKDEPASFLLMGSDLRPITNHFA